MFTDAEIIKAYNTIVDSEDTPIDKFKERAYNYVRDYYLIRNKEKEESYGTWETERWIYDLGKDIIEYEESLK